MNGQLSVWLGIPGRIGGRHSCHSEQEGGEQDDSPHPAASERHQRGLIRWSTTGGVVVADSESQRRRRGGASKSLQAAQGAAQLLKLLQSCAIAAAGGKRQDVARRPLKRAPPSKPCTRSRSEGAWQHVSSPSSPPADGQARELAVGSRVGSGSASAGAAGGL